MPLKAARDVVLHQIEPAVAEIAACERIDRHRDHRQRLRHYRDRIGRSAADDLLLPAASPVVTTFSGRDLLVPTPTAIAYDARNAQVVVASSDRSITMYSASFDRRRRLQFHLDDGLVVRTSSSCVDTGDIGAADSCVLLGDSHGRVSLLTGSPRRLRHHKAHGDEPVRKVSAV